ncbi:MAG: hypothetical protein ACRD2C_17750 [Acidimicrobiales bacterium]
MGIFERLLARGDADERRHREQIRLARRDVRWGKIGVTVAVVGLIATVTIAWVQRDDGGSGAQQPADQPSSAADNEDPLTVAVQTFEGNCDAWFVARPIEQIDFLPEVNPDLDWPEHPAGEGGVPASPLVLRFTVQGRTEADVVLTGMDVQVVERREAPTGVLLQDACGDTGAFRYLGVDLDPDPPEVVSYFSDPADRGITDVSEQERQPVRFPYHVSASEAEVFSVTAWALRCDCEWKVELSWQSQGRSGTTVIDDSGEPFRTVGLSNAVARCGGEGTCEEPLPEHRITEFGPPSAEEVDVAIPLNEEP